MTVDLGFLKSFDKQVEKMDGITSISSPPTYWYSSGNYVLNKITSNSFHNCIPQGRVTGLAGSSGAGKSFVASNIIRNAQKEGAFNLVIDSENSLDDEFVSKIGVDVTKDYKYLSVVTISQVSKVVSAFIKGYKIQYQDNYKEAPKIHITIDSLDMLLTETELEHYEKGDSKGDMGQRSKQLKAMLRTFVQDIKNLNISIIVTCQVYANQDLLNGYGKWIITDAVKYSLSQIILLDKLKLKDDNDKKKITGIRMKCEGYKTRFTKPFQVVTIEVPYDEGMNPLSGLLETAVTQEIVAQKGAWYTIVSSNTKFQKKNFMTYYEEVLEQLKQKTDTFFNVKTLGDDEENNEKQESSKNRRDKEYKLKNA